MYLCVDNIESLLKIVLPAESFEIGCRSLVTEGLIQRVCWASTAIASGLASGFLLNKKVAPLFCSNFVGFLLCKVSNSDNTFIVSIM